MKKILFSIICALLPILASAQEPYAVLSNENTVLTFYYDDQKASHPDAMEIAWHNWVSHRESITSVVIDSSFSNYTTIINSTLFYDLRNLIEIIGIENLNTSNMTSMNAMFYNCEKLTNLNVSNFNTSNVTDMSEMFYGCKKLTNLNLSNFNTSNVTNMSKMFYDCEELLSMDVSNFNTSNVTNMNEMFHSCKKLTNLDVSNFNTSNVTDMGGLFAFCSSLSSLDVSNFNTANVTNMDRMFSGCENLTNLDVSNFNTANVTNMCWMFNGCERLTNLNVSNFNTSNVTNMNEMFHSCKKLTNLDVSNFNTSNVTNMEYMFTLCENLTHLDVSNFNTSNVTDMSSMFYLCKSLTSLDVSNFNTENVTNMGGMFCNCESLTNLDVSNFNTKNVTNMEFMFGNTNFTNLDVSNFNTSNVTNMSYMFSGCSNLTTIKVGSGWSTSQVSASDNMFFDCTSLVGGAGTTYSSNHTDASFAHIDSENDPGYLTGATSGDEPYWQELQYTIEYGTEVMMRARNSSSVDPWMVEELEMFLERADEMYNERTASEQEVRHMIEELNWIIREVEEAMNRPVDSNPEPYAVLSDNNTVLTFYYDGDKEARGGMSVGPFGYYDDVSWYNAHETITLVVFDPSFANCSSITSTANWFSQCSNISQITGLGYLNTTNLTNMSGMFAGCFSLTSLDVRHFNTANVTDMTSMFHACSRLTSLDVSHFNTTNVTDMSSMFASCYSLTSLDVSNFNTIKATNMFGMFDSCEGLTSLDVRNFNTTNVWEMSNMFSGCTGLTSLDLSNFNTAKVTEMHDMFADCSNLRTIYAGEGWSTQAVTQSERMFYGCTNLVGGQGTRYDANHIDAEYAHIDGGTANPGYLTDINGSGTSDLDQRRQELLNMINQLMEEANECAYQLDRKDPQRTSELWNYLADIEVSIMDVRDRTERAESDAELDECEERIRQIREEIAYLYMRIAEYAVGDASFDGLTARVSGSATLDDAFESVGGRAVAAQTIAAIVWNADNALTADMLTGINNPNLLVYVTEASKAPSGVQNVVINGTAAEIVLTDASGNNNFYCPQSFTAQSISYTRSFSQTTQIDVCQGWETISLPFTVQSIRHQANGALVPFGGGNNGYPFWLRHLSSGGLSRATAIEANRPYLICMPNNTVYPSVYNQAGNITFSASNVTVPITSEQTASGAGVTLRPAFQQVAQSGSVYALNVGEARGEYPEGSVFERNYREIRPFQAYTSHGSGTRFITVSSMGGGDDGFTGIESIDSEDTDDNGTWHTLDGRRLEGKPTKKGVYIKDGRKYIIK